MKTHNDIKKVLINKAEINAKIKEIAERLSTDYNGRNPLFICILKGAVIFFSSLVVNMTIDVELEFMAISSYGNGTTSSGEVKVNKDLDISVEGRDVVIVEDIVDSGITLSFLVKQLKNRGAKSVEIACLLTKPSRRKTEVATKYVGFEIPDEFVVGYGLDFAEKFRNLEEVCVLKESAYLK